MDSEDCQHGYVFLVCFGRDGIELDTCIDVSPIVGASYEGYQAKRLLLQGRPELLSAADKEIDFLARQIHVLEIRARFMSGPEDAGPYLLKTPVPLTPEQLTAVLRTMSPERLKEAKV